MGLQNAIFKNNCGKPQNLAFIFCEYRYLAILIKAAELQMLKNKNKKINGKYWSSYVQWRNLLLLTP